MFIPRGINVPALDREKLWDFTPAAELKVGDTLSGGDTVGVRAARAGGRRSVSKLPAQARSPLLLPD